MGTGPWKLEKYTPNVGVTYTKNPDYWDKSRQPQARQQRDQVLREGGGRRSSASRAARSTCSRQFSAGQRQGAAHRPERQRDRAARLPAPPGAHAHGQGAVQRQARAPGGRAADQPRQHRQGPARGQGRLRQRQPVRAGLPVDGQVRRRSASRTSSRPSRCCPRPATSNSASSCATWNGFEMPAVRPADPERPQGRRHRRQAQHHGRRAATTATRCSASRRGWTPRSASPTTATAASPNVFLGAPLQERRHVELGALQEQGVRRARQRLRRGARPAGPAHGGEADPGAAARRGADHLRLLLLLPHGDRSRRSPGSSVSAMGHVDVTQAGQKA